MTRRTLENTLFIHLKSAINNAIPLEYAIRAAKKANPEAFECLSEINKKIRLYWIDLGASEAEIEAESLMDFAWDTIQVGFPLTRRHDRVYPNHQFLNLVNNGLANVRDIFNIEVSELNVPAAGYYRFCDLLNGNDIPRMLRAIPECLRDAKVYKIVDDIEMNKFVFGIRNHIPLHPGMQYVSDKCRNREKSVVGFGLLLDTEMEFSPPALKRQIREFLYQYAVMRQALSPTQDGGLIKKAIIKEFLKDELLGRFDKHKITRTDGFVSVLTGLYCWDLVQQYQFEKRKSAVELAINHVLGIYPKIVREVGYETIRKNYNTARVAINNLKFNS